MYLESHISTFSNIFCTFLITKMIHCALAAMAIATKGQSQGSHGAISSWRLAARRLLAKKVHLAATRQNCQTYTSSVLENCIFFKDSSSSTH